MNPTTRKFIQLMRIQFTTFLLLISVIVLKAQIVCDYTLELRDAFGDGWNGAALQLTINDSEDPIPFFLTDRDSTVRLFSFVVSDGDSLKLQFFSGSFDNEIEFILYDTDGNIVFETVSTPEQGVIFQGVATCPACPPPSNSFINIDNIRAEFADISWLAPDPDGKYIIQYGEKGFNPDSMGVTLTTMEDEARLQGLSEKTMYDFYIASACANGDTSNLVGPISFETVYKVDVGVVEIVNPNSECGLNAMETLEVTLKNFGADPQTLIPFDFSINGVAGGVSMPFDGVFTGVLGKDSTFTIEFDAKAQVGTPNIYEVLVWTGVEKDSDMSNDTIKKTIINIPLVTDYPYFTDFEDWFGGWRIDDTLSQRPSWEFGNPSFGDLQSAASGNNAWVTSLDTTYNDSETSYLISPCLDFTNLIEDPRLTFSLYFKTEACCDEAWVEYTTDGGETWEKVGTATEGLNWYNDTSNNWWDGDGGFEGWVTASNTLVGAAGATEAQVRFVFSSDFSTNTTGMGIDDIFISPPLQNDLAALAVSNTSEEECGSARDEVVFTILNQGEVAQSNFDLVYQVNNEAFIVENFDDTLQPDSSLTYTFSIPFNSSEFNEYTIKAWVENVNEQFNGNDTTIITFVTTTSIPYAEDFEERQLPVGWSVTDEETPITNGHGAPSFVLSDNLWSLDPFFEATSPSLGSIEIGDSLTFDYRYVNFGSNENAAKTLASGDSLLVQFSIDCGETYATVLKIDSTNHEPSTAFKPITIYLDDYVDQDIKVRFVGFWGAGDYYLDIDNFNIIRCPASLDLVATVTDETRFRAFDGSISIQAQAGVAPFTYKWDTGETSKSITGLDRDFYTVIVSDAFGCTDSLEVEVNTLTNTEELQETASIRVMPNPTSNQANLNILLTKKKSVAVSVFNVVGQLIQHYPTQSSDTFNYSLDMIDQENGIYFIRINIEGKIYTERLLLLKE